MNEECIRKKGNKIQLLGGLFMWDYYAINNVNCISFFFFERSPILNKWINVSHWFNDWNSSRIDFMKNFGIKS
jgi:hypothetical protein